MATLVKGERKWVAASTLRKHFTRLNEAGDHERPSGKLKEGMIVYRDDVVYELFLHDFTNNRWYLEVTD